MKNVDLMAGISECACQSIDVCSVAAEAVGRVKGRDVQKAERPIHFEVMAYINRNEMTSRGGQTRSY